MRIFMHANTVENQIRAIRNRVTSPVPQPTAFGRAMTARGIDWVIACLHPCTRWEYDRFYTDYPALKKKRYAEALERVLAKPVTKRIARITAFVKPDKLSAVGKIDPDPRAIQFRDPEYCVLLASSLKPLEEQLYRMVLNHPCIKTKTRSVGKGLNQVERAQLLIKKQQSFESPVVLSLDMSRFDKHVSESQLRQEHRVYLTLCKGNPHLRKLLTWQVYNDCFTTSGIRYTTTGRRMSGDMNTALGNCIIMIAMVVAMFEYLEIVGDILDDGDDCLVILEEADLSRFQSNATRLCLEMGHELKIENVARRLVDVEWCQSKPIHTSRGWKFVRNPIKVLNCSLINPKWLAYNRKQRLAHLAGLGKCELVLSSGVPVLWEFARALIRNSRGAEAQFDENCGTWARVQREGKLYTRNGYEQEISYEARRSFEDAFGISIAKQELWEEALRTWEIVVDGEEPVGPTILSDWSINHDWANESPLG